MGNFRTDFKNDQLNTAANTRRKFRAIENADGTYSFEDVTSYTKKGDNFGAEEVNAIHAGLNSHSSNQADAFSTEKSYAAGDYCIYQNALYRFTADKTAGDWNASKAAVVNIGAEIAELNKRDEWYRVQISNLQRQIDEINVAIPYKIAIDDNAQTIDFRDREYELGGDVKVGIVDVTIEEV